MNANGLDEMDERILDEIRYDAKKKYEDIAKKVGLSRTAVKNRITAMEENDIILRYETKINSANTEQAIRFYVDVETYPNDFGAVMNYLGGSAFIKELYICTGSNHLHAIGMASNSKTMQAFANLLNRELCNVRRLTVCSMLSVCKDSDGGVEYVRYQEPKHLEGEQR